MNLSSSNNNSNASWLYQTANHSDYEWLLSPSYSYSNYAALWNSRGTISNSYVYYSYDGVRASLNLTSQAKIVDGEGTLEEPFVVELGE